MFTRACRELRAGHCWSGLMRIGVEILAPCDALAQAARRRVARGLVQEGLTVAYKTGALAPRDL